MLGYTWSAKADSIPCIAKTLHYCSISDMYNFHYIQHQALS